MLSDRLSAAAALYGDGRIERVLVSGTVAPTTTRSTRCGAR
jgi:vancomycin permeability regulator SanA